jgi:hypothetical protein
MPWQVLVFNKSELLSGMGFMKKIVTKDTLELLIKLSGLRAKVPSPNHIERPLDI